MRWVIQSDHEDAGERARRIHSQWLTNALELEKPYPRIPRRRVDEGGFSRLLSRANARQLIERWWSLALRRVDD
jgi:hypothetical protein